MSRGLEILFAIIGVVVLPGIGYGISYYNLGQDRIEAVRIQYNNYLSGEVSKAKTKLDDFWTDSKNIKYIVSVAPNNRSDKVRILVINNNLESSVQKLFDFYRGVTACVEYNSCDLETTCKLFQEDILAFFSTYSGYLSYLAQQWFKKDFVGPEIKKFIYLSCSPFMSKRQA